MSSEFELIGEETKWEGKIFRAGVERFRHADGKEVTRDKVWHSGRRRDRRRSTMSTCG